MFLWLGSGFWPLVSGFYNIAGAVSFYRHAREGGHPVFPEKHFWIPAFAGMTIAGQEKKRQPQPATSYIRPGLMSKAVEWSAALLFDEEKILAL
jgi:hypothetical protein